MKRCCKKHLVSMVGRSECCKKHLVAMVGRSSDMVCFISSFSSNHPLDSSVMSLSEIHLEVCD